MKPTSVKETTPVATELFVNEEALRHLFGNTSDLRITSIRLNDTPGSLILLTSMASNLMLHESLSRPLSEFEFGPEELEFPCMNEWGIRLFPGLPLGYGVWLEGAADAILAGQAVLLLEGIPEYMAVPMDGGETRSISEPSTQSVIRGPKDAFTESIDTNISLIRRRIRNAKLRFDSAVIGKESSTTVQVAYVEGTAEPGIVREVQRRLGLVTSSAVLDSGFLEEWLEDETYTPFPLIMNSERPDQIAGGLLEGKVAVIVDGSPFVLLMPSVMTDFFRSPEDNYQHFYIASFLRLIRYAAFLISLFFPSLYVSLLTYHYELIPTSLLITIMAQREGVPFPAVVEVFLMELTFEVLREAGIRMPRAIGQTISIVGALVIGQASVEAGIISYAMVIVVALTGICNYVSPSYSFSAASRLLRFLLILVAAFLGFYGILLVLIALITHLVSLRSFGVPYLSPIAPFGAKDANDVVVRKPAAYMRRKPGYLNARPPRWLGGKHRQS